MTSEFILLLYSALVLIIYVFEAYIVHVSSAMVNLKHKRVSLLLFLSILTQLVDVIATGLFNTYKLIGINGFYIFFALDLLLFILFTIVRIIDIKKEGENPLVYGIHLAIMVMVEAIRIVFFREYFISGLLMLVVMTETIGIFSINRRQLLLDQERSKAELQNNITFSQIRPHFLYNCLNSIYYLCGKDPEKAREMISDFSDYLRGDLDSLSGNRVVPFEKELEHTDHYLRLEKVRFEDELFVEYDIEFMDFDIPTLTLQPMVENAVKHGISKKEGGGTVYISSRLEGNNAVIEVRDDGLGFDVNTIGQVDVHKNHVGVNNVKRRIENMYNGSFFIESIPDKGTRVVMTVPVNN